MHCIVVCQYKVLLIGYCTHTVIIIGKKIGIYALSKNNAIAIKHSLCAVNCLNQTMRIRTRLLRKIGHTITKYNGFIFEHARERNLVCTENCVECFQRKFVGPAYTVCKIANVLACRYFEQLTVCTLAR